MDCGLRSATHPLHLLLALSLSESLLPPPLPLSSFSTPLEFLSFLCCDRDVEINQLIGRGSAPDITRKKSVYNLVEDFIRKASHRDPSM